MKTALRTWLLASALSLLAGCGTPRASSPPPAPKAVTQPRPPAAPGSPNIVVCVIDAARADHVGCYGYPRDTTPNLDRLAAESLLFENHFAPYSQTKPSTVSLLTGLYPDTHLTVMRTPMEPSLVTIDRSLAGKGYRTALFSSNPLASPEWGVGSDFDEVFASDEALGKAIPEEKRQGHHWWKTPELLTAAFSDWLDAAEERPFFVYLHLLPPHLPYDAPPKDQRLFAGKDPPGAWEGSFPFREVALHKRAQATPPLDEWVDLYDANLRWADSAVGTIVDLLRQHALLDETILIVTSDHGEAFGEHGYTYHSRGVYDELVHVPLLIKLPGKKRAARFTALTQTVDIAPTLFDLLDLGSEAPDVQGRSLLPLIKGQADRVRDEVYATCSGPMASYLVRDHEYALILYEGGRLRALYDLRADPRQAHNIITERPDVAARMVAAFETFAQSQRRPPLEFVNAEAPRPAAPSTPELTLTEEQRRELKALGYVD